MRELLLTEINSISGADSINDYFYYYSSSLLYSSIIAESAFGGYCGYHLALGTSIASGAVGACVGAIAGFMFIPALLIASK